MDTSFRNFYSQNIYHHWYSAMGEGTESIRYLENVFFCWRFWEIATPQLILIAICFFMHQSDYAHAFYFAERFIKRYGTEDPEIKYYLPACEIFAQMGCKNKDVIKSSDIFRFLEGISNKETLKEIFQNKSAAVVGNGPSAIGLNKGEEIDSHDIVVRFNNFTLDENNIKDYGKKVDMWYLAVWESEEKFVLPDYMKSVKYLFLDADYWHTRLHDGILNVLWTILNERKIQVIVNDFEIKNLVKAAYSVTYPSSGFQVLALLKIFGYTDVIDAYGFSFQDKKKNRRYICSHYHNDVVSVTNWHNFEKENRILSRMFPSSDSLHSRGEKEQYIDMYKELHADVEGFGRSSLAYLDEVSLFIDYLKPKTVLDYGCGKGSIINALKAKYPQTEFYGYDPAMPQFEKLPVQKADFIINTDVLEHIPENSLDGIIREISTISKNAFFALHHAPAVALLPNGENAHCTVKPLRWYENLIGRYFRTTTSLKGRKIYLSAVTTFELPKNIADGYNKIIQEKQEDE